MGRQEIDDFFTRLDAIEDRLEATRMRTQAEYSAMMLEPGEARHAALHRYCHAEEAECEVFQQRQQFLAEFAPR